MPFKLMYELLTFIEYFCFVVNTTSKLAACEFRHKWRVLDVGLYFIAIEIGIGIEFCTIVGYEVLPQAILSTT